MVLHRYPDPDGEQSLLLRLQMGKIGILHLKKKKIKEIKFPKCQFFFPVN